MKTPNSVASLEALGRERLSPSFYMRDFPYSEIASMHGIQNVPDDPDLAIAAGRNLCEALLEPLQATFGRIAIRSAYRSCAVNEFGNQNGLSCASNENNFARHIWDRRDKQGYMGAMACVAVHWFADQYDSGADWRAMAWWIHDNLPYGNIYFFPKLAAFNIGWHENPERRIDSYITPKGCITKPGLDNHMGMHSVEYPGFPSLLKKNSHASAATKIDCTISRFDCSPCAKNGTYSRKSAPFQRWLSVANQPEQESGIIFRPRRRVARRRAKTRLNIRKICSVKNYLLYMPKGNGASEAVGNLVALDAVPVAVSLGHKAKLVTK